jgi:hypothetical protein
MENKISYNINGKLENIDYHIYNLNKRLEDMIDEYKDKPTKIDYYVNLNGFNINGTSTIYLSLDICRAYDDIKKTFNFTSLDNDVSLRVTVFFN